MNHESPHSIWRFWLTPIIFGVLGVGCTASPIPLPFNPAPLPPNTLAYDAPVTLTVKAGTLLPGTSIAYQGKTETGQAKVLIAGLLAPKQTADTVDWQGAPAPGVNVKLTTRVATYDDQTLTLAGSAHIEISDVMIRPGGAPGAALMEFSAPVTYSLKKDEMIPGSRMVYAGPTPNGAQFLGLEGYPYRKQLDSLQSLARLNPRVFLQLDLRVVSYSESAIVVGGTAKITIEE
jgi:hypothetical protein